MELTIKELRVDTGAFTERDAEYLERRAPDSQEKQNKQSKRKKTLGGGGPTGDQGTTGDGA